MKFDYADVNLSDDKSTRIISINDGDKTVALHVDVETNVPLRVVTSYIQPKFDGFVDFFILSFVVLLFIYKVKHEFYDNQVNHARILVSCGKIYAKMVIIWFAYTLANCPCFGCMSMDYRVRESIRWPSQMLEKTKTVVNDIWQSLKPVPAPVSIEWDALPEKDRTEFFEALNSIRELNESIRVIGVEDSSEEEFHSD